MLNKRFELAYTDEDWWAVRDGEIILWKEEVVGLMNELHEENELWKRECKRLKGLYYLENENVRLEDIIGLVRTDEPTDSVELKKELYK